MAQTSWPWENVDTTETQFGLWADALSGSSGVIPKGNKLEASYTVGTSVDVASGTAIVRGCFYQSTATETLNITATSSNTRYDFIVLELDPTANAILLKTVTGTASASPSEPTLTQIDGGVYQYPIFRLTVGTAGVTAIQDRRYYVSGYAPAQLIKESTSSTIDLGYSDRNAIYYVGSSGSTTVNVLNVLNPGERVDFIRVGTGTVTFAAGSGVTLNSANSYLKIAQQWGAVTVTCKSAGVYVLAGNIGA